MPPSARRRGLRRGGATCDALAAVQPAHLGDRSPLRLARRSLGALPGPERGRARQRLNGRSRPPNRVRARLAALTAERDARVLAEEAVDVTLPWDRRPRGARHPLSSLSDRVADVFVAMGYEVAEGPEAEPEWFNFDALNFGKTTRPGRCRTPSTWSRRPRHACCAPTPRRCRPGRCSSATCRSTSCAPAGRSAPTSSTRPTCRSSTSSRVLRSTRASRWRTCGARSTHSPRRCSAAKPRRPALRGRTSSRSPSRPPRSTCSASAAAVGRRPVRAVPDLRPRAGSSGAAAAWSTRGC